MVDKMQAIVLAATPEGMPKETDFRIETVPVPECPPGGLLLHTKWLSVDPYLRGRMTGVRTYIEGFKVGAPVESGAIGVVLVSDSDLFHPGDTVVGNWGWQEFAVYPLFSPQSLIAEGTANFGIDVAFPAEHRIAFERDRLFPLAGLDPAAAQKYYEVLAVLDQLDYAGNEAARRYLNGAISREDAATWLATYALQPRARAEQRVRFFDQYRSYVINYNLGKDLVRAYIEARGGTADNPARRWAEFGALLSSPRLPSALIA